ncbi:hypothetical protein DFH09DRAFT_1088685 [Mycena vulgaris]|nr:hypothetical protein DFH09DRAFT_1088685 [Mycena vulgaris]
MQRSAWVGGNILLFVVANVVLVDVMLLDFIRNVLLLVGMGHGCRPSLSSAKELKARAIDDDSGARRVKQSHRFGKVYLRLSTGWSPSHGHLAGARRVIARPPIEDRDSRRPELEKDKLGPAHQQDNNTDHEAEDCELGEDEGDSDDSAGGEATKIMVTTTMGEWDRGLRKSN